ncbi:hypothetical protein C8J57DRAFT_1233395 [Mycena rebaudengoi]|nr:hypothetical protein C8J57DRAFT_1233395 [Mycena rebaudengoi]
MDELSSPSRMPPFSLLEFGELVTAALDSPDPSFASTSLFPLAHSLERKKSAQNLHLQSSSRMRLLLAKIKQRAVALVKRPRLHFRHTSPAKAPTPRHASPTSGFADHSTRCSSLEPFVPYLPLAVQYERMSPYGGNSVSVLSASSDCSHAPPSPTVSFFSSSESACSGSSTPTTPRRPWSVFTVAEDSDDLRACYDPFAKAAVRVVHRSCVVLPSPSSTPRRRPRRRPLPLPLPLPIHDTSPNDSHQSTSDWASHSPSSLVHSLHSPSRCSYYAPPTPTPTPRGRLARSRSLAPHAHRSGSPFPLALRRTRTTRTHEPPASVYHSANQSACDG